MRSVADNLRADLQVKVASMSTGERVALMFELGRRDTATYAAANGVSEQEAARRIRFSRHAGRRPSVAASFDAP
ncbi:MAG: hypothetical protein ABI665_06825 [Vicinamibacterales bacterium]